MNFDKQKQYQADYYQAHRDKMLEKARLYNEAHRDDRARKYRQLKMEVLNAYGGPACVCCGETLFEGLTIDHIDGRGAEHRRETGSGTGVYKWLEVRGYPSGFQVLCGTCNMAKGRNKDCPHKKLALDILGNRGTIDEPREEGE